MQWEGNIRKMRSELGEVVNYTLPLYDILEPGDEVAMNELVGKSIQLNFDHAIHCVVTGKKIKKVFGEGMSYDAFMNSPEASPGIIRPELSRIHEGIALRDFEWEMKHHMTPHIVYLSKTAGAKVGVTRERQVPTRWIDQGAVEALAIARTPYRQAAGLIEVALKDHIADKTNWQRMLKGEVDEADLKLIRDGLISFVPDAQKQFLLTDSEIVRITYPVLAYPPKVKSLKLDKEPTIEGKLMGIKGQYLLFDDGRVINIRSHAGYRVKLEA